MVPGEGMPPLGGNAEVILRPDLNGSGRKTRVAAGMTVFIKLFGPLSRVAGSGELAIAVGHPRPTCGEIRTRLATAEPLLAAMLPACRFAINHDFVADDREIAEGDEVALIGLTSGG